MEDKKGLEPEVIDELEQGRLIAAIKILRKIRGIGLKEAKELIDSYLEQNPYIKVDRAGGRSGAIILLAIIFLAYTLYRILFLSQ
ncbi:MAG: ribosomal protein L7/L12 [Gammaproteobacteria bacterium]